MVVLLANLGLTALLLAAVVGPLVVGRMLADRDITPDPDVLAAEAEALCLLAGPMRIHPRQLPPRR